MNSEKREQLANVGTGAHTAGPWTVEQDGERTHICGKNAVHVARVTGQIGNELHEGNARLIAAAPELLEALRVLLAPLQHTKTTAQAEAQARAAIARATGAAS